MPEVDTRVISTREGKLRVRVTRFFQSDPEDRKRHEDRYCPATSEEPEDHAVTRGRDVSLHGGGGHSPDRHTVALEDTKNLSDQTSQKQNTLL